MAFYKDYDCVIGADTVSFREKPTPRKYAASLPSFPQDQGLVMKFNVFSGTIRIQVSSLNYLNPQREELSSHIPNHSEDPGLGPETIETFNHVPFELQLFAPGQSIPAATWRNDVERWNETEMFEYTYSADSARRGLWKCIVTNKGSVRAQVDITVRCFFDIQKLQNKPIPLVLLDNAYRLILEALQPSFRIFQDDIYLTLGDELREYFGENLPETLGEQRIDLPDNVHASGRMLLFDVEPTSGQKLLEAMQTRWQEKKTELEEKLRNTNDFFQKQALTFAVEKNDEWKKKWESQVQANFPTVHANVAISRIEVDYELDLLITEVDIDLAEIDDFTIDLFISFDPSLEHCFALVISSATFSGGAADIAEYLGIIKEANEYLEEKLPEPIEKAGSYIGRYLGEAMVGLCAQDSVFMRLTADDLSWNVSYTGLPKPRSIRDLLGTPFPAFPVDIKRGGGGIPGVPERPRLGEIPSDFVIQARAGETLETTLERLDKIKHIVVIMMENRSFDHMLGYLRNAGRDIEGLTGDETNRVEGRTHPIKVWPARDVVAGVVTQIIYSPHHKHSEVMKQIGEGRMDKFAQNLEDRYPNEGVGEYAMAYYTGEELPTYHTLASEYAVCDHWFAAFPGGTWPNRWVTLTGKTPDLYNFEVDDPRLGYLKDETIFDLLGAYNIKWKVFESDLSLIRTYDRHRLNTDNVVPLHRFRDIDPRKDFFELASSGDLPAVSFVEPNFYDIPPRSTADDDLCPVDLRRGQGFIAEIFGALESSPKWDATMLVITYDEHGGFFDHVPPPGTPVDLEAGGSSVPLVHPEAPSHLGVRVPTFVVSPLVGAGSVCSEIFDHTSIIKTILVRFREHFPATAFTKFGERVKKAAHLGLALELDEPRTDRIGPLPRKFSRIVSPSQPGFPSQRFSQIRPEPDDFDVTLRRGFLPKHT